MSAEFMSVWSGAVVPRDDPNPSPDGRPEPTTVPSAWALSRTKRLLDLCAGAVLTILTLPIIAVLCIGSAVAFRSWPIFRQRRLGRNGLEFTFFKIRSLPPRVPEDIDKYRLQEHPSSGWGRFIRSTHLDEFPQAWLLLTGRMSLVGPRPEMPSLSDTYDPGFVAARLQVRPGIIGPWQISPDSAGLIGESPTYDLWYLGHASPMLDLWLVWRTFLGLFGGRHLGLSQYPSRFLAPG